MTAVLILRKSDCVSIITDSFIDDPLKPIVSVTKCLTFPRAHFAVAVRGIGMHMPVAAMLGLVPSIEEARIDALKYVELELKVGRVLEFYLAGFGGDRLPVAYAVTWAGIKELAPNSWGLIPTPKGLPTDRDPMALMQAAKATGECLCGGDVVRTDIWWDRIESRIIGTL
jgi:hypothetical protein